MERDTLRDYLGKLVKVRAREGRVPRDAYPTYVGKVSNYDHDFVTLNPFTYLVGRTLRVVSVGDKDKPFESIAQADIAQAEAGTTVWQKTLSRRCVETIEQMTLEDLDDL